jgi:hypothetical protein
MHTTDASTQRRVYTLNTSRTLPIFGLQGDLWTIADHLMKIAVSLLTTYRELEEVSPLLF